MAPRSLARRTLATVALTALLALAQPSAAPAQSGLPPTVNQPTGVRARIVRLAESQLGYHDHGRFCTKYGPCEVWCALFASWVWGEAGVAIPSYAFTGSFYYWARSYTYVLRRRSAPRPGDAVLYGSGPAGVDTSLHMGIVEDVYPGYLVTIEGDTWHAVRRYVVPIRHATKIGEPGPIYAYAAPVASGSASTHSAGTIRLTAAQLRRAIAAQDHLTPTDRRLRRTVRRLRAFQHMPYTAPGLAINWTGITSSGQPEVTVLSSGTLSDAQAAWQTFLTRYDDAGAAYAVTYQPSRP